MATCPHINIIDPEIFQGGAPHEAFAELRKQGPLVWHEDGELQDRGFWLVTQHKELDYISKHPDLFSSYERTCFLMENQDMGNLDLLRLMIINMDPPDHIKYRRIIRKMFTPKAINAHEDSLRQYTKDMLDRVAPKGECEFVNDIAAELPLIAICELMGIPIEDRNDFFEWTNTMIGGDDPELSTSPEDGQNASAMVYLYCSKLYERYSKHPEDNLVTSLINGDVDGEALTPDEFNSFFLILVVAGNETTRTATSHGMRLLLDHPEQLQMLVDQPKLIPDFIEETLRYNTAVNYFMRTATQDVEIGGETVQKGQRVMLMYHSANHDEQVFKDPHIFDITRPQREEVKNNQRAFGIGEHFCLGTHLARLEMRLVFEEVIKRIKNPKLNGEIRYLRSNFINGIKELPLKFDAE
jgi:cytochrome P450